MRWVELGNRCTDQVRKDFNCVIEYRKVGELFLICLELAVINRSP